MDLNEIAVIAEDAAFVARVRAGIVTTARVVIAEPSGTEGHPFRLRYARAVLRSSLQAATNMAYAVATTTGFEETIDDAGLLAIIAGLWNEYAGV